MRARFGAALLVSALLSAAASAAAEERIELPSRGGMQPIEYIPAATAPVASVILFPGGQGVIAETRNNFLLRVRDRFAEQGLAVAVADAPSDHGGGMGTPFRTSAPHARDVAVIIAFLKSKAPVPVWLVGTSRGTISAANAAARLGPAQVAGIVLTSTVWSGGISEVPIATIAVPTLVVHNRDDGCSESPYIGAAQSFPQFAQAPAKDFISVSGGASKSRPCDALSPHGYYQIENQVVPPIIEWIKAHTRAG
jgi:pimeloyl-ACP methyl ester carboxylesterase